MASCSDTKFLEAIQEVETGGLEDPSKAVGDQGRSIGPLQIMKGYYNDAVQQDPSLTEGGKTYQDVTDVEYARKVVVAYMNRYATEGRLGRKPTYEDFARIHNGGPNGYKKSATDKYWDKVKSHLD